MSRVSEILAELVRIPSENTPPVGAEAGCQAWIADFLRELGLDAEVYRLAEVEGLEQHPLYWPGRDYSARPNVFARLRGSGGGQSLILSGHIDTVPVGGASWTHPPFGATESGGRMYGRGVWDMKAGVASALAVIERLRRESITLRGDLLFESVVDEEFGGVNGTLAGRVRGCLADAAILGEPSKLRVTPAQRGGRIFHVTFRSAGDIFANDHGPTAVEQLSRFLNTLPGFQAMRLERAPRSDFYLQANPVPVFVTNIQTSQWGSSEPIAIPSQCRLEIYYETMPGETQQEIEAQFFEWLDSISSDRHVFPSPPEVTRPIRFLPASFTPRDHPFIKHFSACASRVLGSPPPVEGIEAPCDMYVFHQFGMPALLWGPNGGNAHLPDEYTDLDSLDQSTEVLYEFAKSWCG
ncbi:MAG: M20/M25/M40 family metallo-hydrolase [Acidobacteria bacterium]|nr:M20/M25/M40 family metallo-hydrolase [Acidobacteriota bacterium]